MYKTYDSYNCIMIVFLLLFHNISLVWNSQVWLIKVVILKKLASLYHKDHNETHPYIKFHPKSILMVFASNTEFKYLPLCNNMFLRQCIATVKLVPSIIWEIPVLLLKSAKTQTIILKESSKRVNLFCWIIMSPKWCSHDQVIVITTWNYIDCIHFTVKILFIRMA